MSHSDCFNSLKAKGLRLLCAMCLAAIWPLAPAFSQCSLTCNDGLQIALDASGQVLVTTQLIAPNAADDCPGALQLKLFTPQGAQIPNNILNCSHIGTTVTAQVKHLASGNSCSGTLTVEDFLPPSVTCTDKFIYCNQDASPGAVGFPVMTDNCTPSDNLTFSYIDEVVALPCGTVQNGHQVAKRIDRSWYVADAYGNTNECLQKIWLKHITFANVVFPPSLDGILNPSLDCGQDPDDLSITGQPTVEGIPIDNSPDCEFGVVHADQVIDICPPAGYSIIRTWTAIDFCTGQVTNRIQVIKVEDKTPPDIAPVEDITVGTDGFTCTGTVELPSTTTSDNCSAVTVTPSWLYGTGFGPFIGVSEGVHLVTYTATDACGNIATTTMHVTVADASPPAAICATSLQVSLTASGIGYVHAGTVNGGSFDNCGPVELGISRDDSTYTATVQVTCADIGPPLLLTLRVTDAVGLENFCVSEVSVRDFLKPNLTCPANVTLTCLQDHNDQQLTGTAAATDNCALQGVDFVDIVNIAPCNVGSVTRMWTATDVAGNTKTCAQQITVNVVSNVQVTFPPDVTVGVCADPSATLPPATGEPDVSGQFCSPLSVTYTDQVFNSALPPGCYRIFRSWKVIDFCVYDPNDGTTGVWEHTQLIDIVDDVPPVIAAPADLTVNADFPDCSALVTLDAAAASDCSAQVAIANNSIYANAAGADASGVYPPGVHPVVFTATDGCGNTAQQTLMITVQDLLPPKALCKNGLVVPLDTAGKATLDAFLIDDGSSDHCTPAAHLSFAVSPGTFSCQTIGNQQVTLTVTDAAGNAATCSSTVTVTDPNGACLPPPPPAFVIEGTIRTENGAPVAEIPLFLQGDGYAANSECDSSGHYLFEDVPGSNYYTLRPASNAKWLNGLTTYDLVLISKHILGLDTLDSPFKLIAADANRSGTVTTFDIVQFRKVILGISDTVPGNTSWRFIDAGYSFPNPADPFNTVFPEEKIFNTLISDQTGQDFIGIKIGDLNNSTDAADPRSLQDTLFICAPQVELRVGETTAFPVFLKNWEQLEGFQFELKLDPERATFQKVEFANPSVLGATHMAYQPDGTLAVSWDDVTGGRKTEGDSLLFVLYLSARGVTDVSDILSIRTERILPEAYRRGDAVPAAIGLNIGKSHRENTEGFEIYPARPNPFNEGTAVLFHLARPALSRLVLADIAGKVVLEQQRVFPAGLHQWNIRREELPGAGFYYYRVVPENLPGQGGVLILSER